MTVHKHDPEIRKINREFRAKMCWARVEADKAIVKASQIRNVTGDNSGYRELLERLVSCTAYSSL